MLFWIAAALLTLGSSLVVLVPLAGRTPRYAAPREHELEVYRDQLAELDRDAARGLIQPAEVSEARAEIGRRIIRAAGDGAGEAPQPRFGRLVRAVSAAAVLAVSFSAVFTAVLFFLDFEVIGKIFLYFVNNPVMLVLLILSAVISAVFVCAGPVKVKNAILGIKRKDKH